MSLSQRSGKLRKPQLQQDWLFHSTWVHTGFCLWDPPYYHVVYCTCPYFNPVVCKLFTFYSSSTENNELIRSRLGRDDHLMVFYNIFCFITETTYISQDTKKGCFLFLYVEHFRPMLMIFFSLRKKIWSRSLIGFCFFLKWNIRIFT